MAYNRRKRKVKKNIPEAQAHISSTYNNTLVTITDKEGNILLNGVRSFKDFGARVQITKYENMKEHIAGKMILEELKKQEKSPENAANSNQVNIISGSNTSMNGNATTGSEPQQIPMKRPERKRPATKNPHGRESVLSKLHEYQRYVDQKKPKAQ